VGGLSDRGILQRFLARHRPRLPDHLIRMRFDLVDDYEWYRRTSGARYWSGSVNTRDEAIGAEFKARAPLGDRWAGAVDLTHQSLLELSRQPGTARGAAHRAVWCVRLCRGRILVPQTQLDVGLGTGWQRGNAHVEIGLTALDAFTNVIYGDLKVQTRRPTPRSTTCASRIYCAATWTSRWGMRSASKATSA